MIDFLNKIIANGALDTLLQVVKYSGPKTSNQLLYQACRSNYIDVAQLLSTVATPGGLRQALDAVNGRDNQFAKILEGELCKRGLSLDLPAKNRGRMKCE